MQNLPTEIWSRIQRNLPLRDQPQFRQVSTQTARAQFLSQKQCCEKPSSRELANWLLEERRRIAPNYKFNSNVQVRYETFPNTGVGEMYIFEDNSNPTNRLKFFMTKSGDLFYVNQDILETFSKRSYRIFYQLITSQQELENLLKNKSLRILTADDLSHVWPIIKDILQSREQCIANYFSITKCMFNLLKKYNYLLYIDPYDRYSEIQSAWRNILGVLDKILNEQGKQKLITVAKQLHPNLPNQIHNLSLSLFFNNIPGFLPVVNAQRSQPAEIRSSLCAKRTMNGGFPSSYMTVQAEAEDDIYQQNPDYYVIQLNNQLKYLYSQLTENDLV